MLISCFTTFIELTDNFIARDCTDEGLEMNEDIEKFIELSNYET